MRLPGDLENGSAVFLSLVDIIEFVSAVFICRCRRIHHVCGRRLAHTRIHKRGEDGNVEDIPCVEERLCRIRGEIREAEHGLLRGDEGTDGIDVHVAVQPCQRDGEGVTGRRGREGSGIIYDDAGDAHLFLSADKGVDHVVRVGEVTLDVKLLGCAVGLLQRARGEGDLVALRRKGACDALADVRSSAEDEDNRRCARHDGVW